MKIIVGILLIVLILVMVMLLSLVSYLLWNEVYDIYQENRKKAIAMKRLEDEMERVCDEPQIGRNDR